MLKTSSMAICALSLTGLFVIACSGDPAGSGSSVSSSTSGSNKTFATTFDPNPRYACGYLNEFVTPHTTATDAYFVAISATNYSYMHCGRKINLTIKAQCGSSSKLDAGLCVPESKKINKTIKAILVDRCPDAIKCVAPSHESHDVANHIDLGPQSKAKTNLGPLANYEISWKWSGEDYTPMAYIVGSSSDSTYFRIGLMMSKGVSQVTVDGQAWSNNDTQAEFKKDGISGLRDRLLKGLTISVKHTSDGSTASYFIKSDLKSPKAFGNELIYKATIQKK